MNNVNVGVGQAIYLLIGVIVVSAIYTAIKAPPMADSVYNMFIVAVIIIGIGGSICFIYLIYKPFSGGQ